MERRDFIKTSCSLCVAIGAGLLVESLSSCSPLPIYKTAVNDNKVVVPLSLFSSGDVQLVRASNLSYDIALMREADNTYTALLLECTHARNPLVKTGTGYVCNLHGSAFDAHGQVTKGPAVMPLKKYATSVSATDIAILLS